MSIWRPDDKPVVTLRKYHIFYMEWPDEEVTDHICGETPEGEGRVSSKIVEKIGDDKFKTRSGRVYHGLEYGWTDNALYVKRRWLALNPDGREVEV